MPRFDRYILSQLTILFGFFSLVLVSVYWVNRAVALFEQLIGDGQSALVFLEFTALTLPNVIRLVLPISAFAGTVYVINRLTSESEMVVMQAMGCSPWRLARPVILFGLMVAALTSVLTHVLVPASRAQLEQREDEIARDITARFLSEGQFLHPARNITFYIREITPTGELRDMFLSDARNPVQRTTYTAKRALLLPGESGPKLVMFDGMAQTLRHDGERLSTTSFADFAYDVGGLIEGAGMARRDIEVLSTRELLSPTPALLEETGDTRAEFLYEGHARIAQPFLAVAGAVIGFGALMLGGYSRFGVGRQVMLAIVLLIAVQLIDNSMADIARRDAGLWPVTYLSPVAGTALGLGLIWLGARPRRLGRGREAPA